MKRACFCLLVVPALLLGCSTPVYVLKPTGEKVKITTRGDERISGELLAVGDSDVVISASGESLPAQPGAPGGILRLKAADLRELEVQGISDRSWFQYVMLFEGVPTLLFAIAAGSYDADLVAPALLAGGILTGLNLLVFELSTPSPPRAEEPVTAEQLGGLRMYA